MNRLPAAILGPGNIGTDLLLKLERSERLEPALVAGIYADSDGLVIARVHGVATSDRGVDAVLERDDIRIVFDATGAAAHLANIDRLRDAGKRVIDLTPAATGPYVVPGVNLYEHLHSPD